MSWLKVGWEKRASLSVGSSPPASSTCLCRVQGDGDRSKEDLARESTPAQVFWAQRRRLEGGHWRAGPGVDQPHM